MVRLTVLAEYHDDRGNRIVFPGSVDTGIAIKFAGSNNTLVIADPVRIARLSIDFDCDNGLVEIGPSSGVPSFSAAIRVGQDSTVRIGSNVSSTTPVAMSVVEGGSITIGDDVMLASENQIRADDGHPIFDVHTGLRVNVVRDIQIGNHVWLGRMATVLAGARIGDGSVIGYASIVTRPIPNNCVAAGSPAKVLRRDIAWERPHLSLVKPFYKPDASSIVKSPYWNPTDDGVAADPVVRTARGPLRRRVRRWLGRIRRRFA